MVPRPIIFISATSDLRSARSLVGEVLFSMGYEPHWQDIEPTDGGELLAVIRRWIDPSALVIQLVGQRYGAEPPRPTEEFGRVSYTQFEGRYAERIGKKVIYHFIDPSFPTDPAQPESEELTQLQAKYRQDLVADNKLRHGNIASTHELELSIRRISAELVTIRAQADRRFRRLFGLIAASLAGVIVVAGLMFMALRQHYATDVQIKQVRDELAASRSEVLAALAPKPMAANQAQPEPLPPALLEKAKILLDRGNAADQALAKIAFKQHDEADRIIQELKSQPGNPIDEAIRLLTMEGDNWYHAGQPDKAVEPYEQALALRPKDVQARGNVALSHTYARLGSIASHRRRAIEVAEGSLQFVTGGSADWARWQFILGIAWATLPTGDKNENQRKAIAAHEATLTVYTKESYPDLWAWTQGSLAQLWATSPTGDRGENLKKAFAAHEAALTVHTKEGYPAAWAWTQGNLGSAWASLPTGDRGENLKKAFTAYEAALTVRTKERYPADWAWIQRSLGHALASLPTGDQGENLAKAIAAYEAALTVFTKEAYPTDCAWTQYSLGLAWSNPSTGDRGENLKKAIDAFEVALTVRTKVDDPWNWAITQNNLGVAWAEFPTGDRGENLRRAFAAYEAALTVLTKDAHPADWARTQENIGNAWSDLPTGDRADNLRKSIAAYEAALTVYTRESYPERWAHTQQLLGLAWVELPTGVRGENLQKAIAAYEAALTVYTMDAYPDEWALTQIILGNSWFEMPMGIRSVNLRKAITAFEVALTMFTKESHPDKWAQTQLELAISLHRLSARPRVDRCDLLRRAIGSAKGALLIRTPGAFPQDQTVRFLQALRTEYESARCEAHTQFDEIKPAK